MLYANIAQVQIGHLTIEGLLADDGIFYVAIPQMVSINLVPPNRSSKQLESLLGKAFSFHKLKTPLNSKAINAIKLTDFESIVVELAIKGNPQAQQMTRDLVGLSLYQVFCDAFQIKFEVEERQNWLRERQTHRESFHPLLTKWLNNDADGNPKLVNWGKEVNDFKRACQLPITPIETWNADLLSQLNRAEASYDSLRRAGLSHSRAISVLSSR